MGWEMRVSVRAVFGAIATGLMFAFTAMLLVADSSEAAFPPAENGRITFARCDPSKCDIWLMNSDGSGQVDLTNTPPPGDEFDPQFSPDGKRIVFRRDDGTQRDLMIMNTDGSGQVNLTNTPAQSESRPTFTPDGQSIVFDRFDVSPGGTADIWMMRPDGSGQVDLSNTPSPEIREIDASVSPDGRRIAYRHSASGVTDIWAMNADGSGQQPLTNTPESDNAPRFSPDGRRITFQSEPPDGFDEIFLMNADGSGPVALTNSPPPAQQDTPA